MASGHYTLLADFASLSSTGFSSQHRRRHFRPLLGRDISKPGPDGAPLVPLTMRTSAICEPSHVPARDMTSLLLSSPAHRGQDFGSDSQSVGRSRGRRDGEEMENKRG